MPNHIKMCHFLCDSCVLVEDECFICSLSSPAVHCRQLIGHQPVEGFVCKNSLGVCTEKNLQPEPGRDTQNYLFFPRGAQKEPWWPCWFQRRQPPPRPPPPHHPPPPPHTGAAASSVKDAEAQRAAGSSTWQPQSERMKSQLCAPWDVKTTAAPCVTENARWRKKKKKKNLQSTHQDESTLPAWCTHTHTAMRKWKV